MKKTNQTKKTKDLESMPNFSLGLTPSEEEGEMKDKKVKNQMKRGGGTKINDESSDDNKKVKEKRLSQNNKGKKNEDTDGNSEEQNIDQRLRHKLSIPKVYDLMESIKGKKREDDILKLLNESGFGGLTHLCKWTKIHTFFVEWIVKHFEKENMWIRLGKTDVLPLTEQDVHRVYGLPMSGEQINVDRCSEAAIKKLRKELGLVGNYSTFVKVTELESQMKKLEKPMSWVKGAICLIIHNILCPTNSSFVSLHYAQVLEQAASYNWCSHVLQYMKDGLQNPDVANPLADFHFLMINYLDKMGKRSPLLTGNQKFPSLRDWDVKTATQDLQKVHDLMGLEHGLTVAVKRLYRTDEGPLPMCFDPDTCPLSKAEEYLDHYRGCIRIYNGAVQTLERRIAEDVGTSAKQHAIAQKQKGEDDESENDDSEDGGNVNGESEDTESDDAAGNSDVKRVNSGANEHENDDESDDDEVAKTISEESKEAGSKEAQAAGAETEVGESSNAKRFNNDQNEINAELLDESVKAACNVGLTLTQETIIKFPQFFDGGEAKDAEFNNENQSDEDVEINLELLDESVKAACNVGMTLTQETIEKFPQYFDGGETKHADLTKNDSETKDSESQGMDTMTQETILKFPQFFKSDLNKTESVSQGSDSVTAETILKYPEFFYAGEASTKKECSQSLALVLYEAPPTVKHEDKSDSDVCIDATPLRSVLPDEVIDLDSAEPVQKKKRRTHDMLYSSGAIPERKRPLKKSKYLSSPYDEAVHESKTTKTQKDLATYAWSDVHDKHQIMYCSSNKAHSYALERDALYTLRKDEWVSCLVINCWVNCLNWDQQDNMRRLVTPLINYIDKDRMPPVSRNIACWRFIERLRNFKYLDWKNIDPTKLEYIMTPAIVGNPGCHYVCFVVNLKNQKFQFLNSLSGVGETLETKDGKATSYKLLFDVWLNEVEAFVADLYKKKKDKMPYEFDKFSYETPKVPTQMDSDNCGVFCMKFLAEWGPEMQSFKGWTKLKKKGDNSKVGRITDLRIEICSEILSHPSNSKRDEVEKEATTFIEQNCQNLPSSSVRNH